MRLLNICAVVLLGATAHGQSAESILQKTRDTYVGLKSYADTGTILYEYGASSEDKHSFSTAFSRSPRHLRLDFHKQGGDRYVIWGDPDAFHTWWKTTGQQTDYPNPNNAPAISMSGQNTGGAALKVPTLLYGKVLGAAMLNIHDPELDGTEQIGVRPCHRIIGRMSDVYAATGKEVNIRKATVWIDTESFLVRKMEEEAKSLPGQRNRIITSYEPRANPTLDDASFKFTPPTE
jgi:outer membrane lipoprotein-sorting protein